MSKPLYAPNQHTIGRGLRREIESIKRRACGPWIYVGTLGVDGVDAYLTALSPPFQSGWTNISSRKVTRFRWLLGGGVEIQIRATGGTAAATIFTLPLGYYDPSFDPAGSGHDNTGVYRAWHIDGTTGNVIDGP